LSRALDGQAAIHWELQLGRKDGCLIYAEFSVVPVVDDLGKVSGTLALCVDITDRRRLQDQLRQSQKMEAVGQLAGGVAHDFNNLLAVIAGYTELVLVDADTLPPPAVDHLRQVLAAAGSAADLTRQLLAFGRKQVMQLRPLNINEIIGNLTKMLTRIIGEDIQLQCEYVAQTPCVNADPGMVEQVIINLIVNARDAMPRGGRILITTDIIGIDSTYTRAHPEFSAGEYVSLSVSDTGTGIAADALPHIFEPFFTTKAVGKGTGLGLATVYGIVKQHEGVIHVESNVGSGARFTIYLPRVEAALLQNEESTFLGIPRGIHVLLVEDDAGIREMEKRVLESYGALVETAASGHEGVDAFLSALEQEKPFHLVVTDLVMPDMPGTKVLEKVKSASPQVPVVIMSGYLSNLQEVTNADATLQKPFSSSQLLRTLARVLPSPVVSQRETSSPSSKEERSLATNEVSNPSGRTTPLLAQPPQESDRQSGDSTTFRSIAPGKLRILVADDDLSVLDYLCKVLSAAGHLTKGVSSGSQAIKEARTFYPDLLLVDYNMPGLNGIQTIQALRPVVPDALSVVITGYADLEVATGALREAAFDFLRKPVSGVEIRRCIDRAVAHQEERFRAERQKSFLSILSHELRYSLHAPLSFTSSLLSGIYGPLSNNQRDRLERVALGIRTQTRLVNNLLNLSYIESGRFHVQSKKSSLTEVVQEAVKSFDIQAGDLGVRLLWVPSAEPFVVQMDGDLIKEAISNLIGNALEHSVSGGSVEVQLHSNDAEAHCSVRDEGVGIAAVHQQKIFEKFFQIPSSPTRSRRGLGIGLYIAQGIAKAHGGRVTVESSPGTGSKFTLALPSGQMPQTIQDTNEKDNNPNCR
jgi:signal transduction histidine kinase